MNAPITTAQQSAHEVEDRARYLRSLARSFEHTGNTTVADDLRMVAADLEHSAKQITDAIGEDLNQHLRSSRQAVGDTLKTVLTAPASKGSEASMADQSKRREAEWLQNEADKYRRWAYAAVNLQERRHFEHLAGWYGAAAEAARTKADGRNTGGENEAYEH